MFYTPALLTYLTAVYIQGSKADNVVFGLVRDKGTATKLLELASGSSNIHVLQADITDVPALKVRSPSMGCPFLACSSLCRPQRQMSPKPQADR